MLLKPHVPQYVVNLTLAVILATTLLYGFVSVPSDLDQQDTLLWIYARGKLFHGLSQVGGYIGFGHSASIYRSLKTNWGGILATNHTTQREVDAALNITEETINGVDVRIYVAKNKIRKSPCIIFFHGGMWISGSLDNDDQIASHLAQVLGVVVISVDYRLAPEDPYPAGLDDCYTVTEYSLSNAESLGIDPLKTALFGIDAGANLAAAVSLRLRDTARHLPVPELQVLVNPVLQAFDFNTPSYHQNQYDASLPKRHVVNCWLWYARGWDGHRQFSGTAMSNYHTSAASKQSKMASYVDHNLLHRKLLHQSYLPSRVDFGDDRVWSELKDIVSDPYFAPLMAPDLRAMPSTYVVAAQYDVTRDDAFMFAKRLEKAGNRVTVAHYDKAIHDTFTLRRKLRLGETILKDIEMFLLRNF